MKLSVQMTFKVSMAIMKEGTMWKNISTTLRSNISYTSARQVYTTIWPVVVQFFDNQDFGLKIMKGEYPQSVFENKRPSQLFAKPLTLKPSRQLEKIHNIHPDFLINSAK